MPRRSSVSRPITVARTAEQDKPEVTQVINFISALIKTQVGEDEKPSPLLESLISDMGARAVDVEVAQDICLLALDIMDYVAEAVDSGSTSSLVFGLLGIISPAIPEIDADIRALKR